MDIRPYLGWDVARNVDGRLTWERTITSFAVGTIALLVAVPRIVPVRKQTVKVLRNNAGQIKLVTWILAIILRVATLVLPALYDGFLPIPARAADCIGAASTLVLAVLSYYEHRRCVRPSNVLIAYLFFRCLSTLFENSNPYVERARNGRHYLNILSLLVDVILLVLESLEKKEYLREPYCHYAPEALAGMPNRIVFWWLRSLFIEGRRRALEPHDLPTLDSHLSTAKLQKQLQKFWALQESHNNALFRATLLCIRGPLFKIVFPRVSLSLLHFCQPLLIHRAVSLVAEVQTEDTWRDGVILTFAAALIYIGIGVFNSMYKHEVYRAATMTRGALTTMIATSTLQLDATLSKDSAAVTLMSTDIERITLSLTLSDYLWASPPEIMVALYLLQQWLGIACVVPFVICIGCIILAYFIGSTVSSRQKMWVNSIQKRVGHTATILGSMRAIKMMGLSRSSSARLENLKNDEKNLSIHYRWTTSLRNTISNFSNFMSPALTFLVYSLLYLRSDSGQFSPASAFTSLSIMHILGNSLQWFVVALTNIRGSMSSYQRIEDYVRSTQAEHNEEDKMKVSQSIHTVDHLTETTPLLSTENEGVSPSVSTGSTNALVIKEGFCSYKESESYVLKNIDTKISPGSLVMIAGPIGCGKTTLLKAVLGEIPLAKGSMTRSFRDVGYCGQEPWLPNTSIQEAILAISPMDEEWYQFVLKACALESDLDQLERGDLTKLGSKGVSLSGGQKQRVALARALYSRKMVLLLDDVLSGLDGKTQDTVVENIFGQSGICRKQHTTVLLVTHEVKHLRLADHVILLSKDGTITEQGTYKDLRWSEDYLNRIVQSSSGSNAQDKPVQTGGKGENTAPHPLADESDSPRSDGDFSIYLYYIKSTGWAIGAYVAMQAVSVGLDSFSDIWLRWWSTAETRAPGRHTLYYAILFCLLEALSLVLMTLTVLLLSVFVVPGSSVRLHKRILDAVMQAPYPILASIDIGQVLNRFSQDMSFVDMQLPTAILQTVHGFLLTVGQTLLVSISMPLLVPFVPFAMFVLYIVQRFYLRTSRQLRHLDLELRAPLYTHFLEMLSGLITIRAFGWQPNFNKKMCDLLDESQRPHYLLFCVQRWLSIVLDCIVTLFVVGAVGFATLLPRTEGSSGAALGVALVNLLTISSGLSYVIRAWTDLETSIGAVVRIRDFETSMPRELGSDTDVPATSLPRSWPRGDIQFKGASLSYSSKESDAHPILRDISLDIRRSTRTVIRGRTGSGKSTLLLCLFGMVEVVSGKILIDGIDISTIPRSLLRDRILAIPQAPDLLSGSLRENIDPYDTSNDLEIFDCLKLVDELLADKILARGGLSLSMDDTGFSAGERQLLLLVSVILRKRHMVQERLMHSDQENEPRLSSNNTQDLPETGIVVLDEFTGSIDLETEKRILGIVEEEFRGWTIVSVAHRMEVGHKADVIVTLEDGTVADVWTNAEE